MFMPYSISKHTSCIFPLKGLANLSLQPRFLLCGLSLPPGKENESASTSAFPWILACGLSHAPPPHPHFSSWPILWMHWRPGKGLGSTKNDLWSLCPTRSHCLLCPPWRKEWSEKPRGPRGSCSGRCPGNLSRKKGNGCVGLQKDRKQHMQGRDTGGSEGRAGT